MHFYECYQAYFTEADPGVSTQSHLFYMGKSTMLTPWTEVLSCKLHISKLHWLHRLLLEAFESKNLLIDVVV